jgi:uncharacterized protein (TIGR02722 family)
MCVNTKFVRQDLSGGSVKSGMRLRTGFGLLLLGSMGLFGTACSPGFEGEYSDPAKQEIVDDKWNETDAHKTAQSMIKGMLEKPWLAGYKKSHGGQKPIVVVDDIDNNTDEHLDVKALTDFIQDELINSGDVRFVNKQQRQHILDEIKYQQGNVKKDMAKKGGKQIGASYMLTGGVSSSVHQMDELKTVTYQTVLKLTDIESAEIVWTNKYEIKKRFKRSGAGW